MRADPVARTVIALDKLKSRPGAMEVLEDFASRVEATLGSTRTTRAKNDVIARLTGGGSHSPAERFDLEAGNMLRWFQLRHDLLRDSLSASQVATLLGTSRQTPHDRLKAGALLAIRDKGALRFPAWQFDSTGPDGVVAGLAEVSRTLDLSPIEKINWFVRRQAAINDRTPIEALRAGDTDSILDLAISVGVS